MLKIKIAMVIMAATATLCACSNETGASATSPQPTPSAAPIQTAAAADPLARGAKLYKRCVTCHTLEDGGRHKVGPNLWAVYGSTAGTREGFAYSKAMETSGLVWDDQTLNGYIENPREFMPGNRMSYAGLRKAEDREALLAYMKRETTSK